MAKFFSLYGELLLSSIVNHVVYVLVCVSIGGIIGLCLGTLLSRYRSVSKAVIPLLSIFQTIPGIVFIGILFMYTGMRPITIIIALSIYAVFPVLKNTYLGLIEVPYEYLEAAKGCGMNQMQSLFKVELPMALPVIFSGIRMSTIYITSWTVLAAMIGQGGLGNFVYTGVAANDSRLIIAGAIPSAVIAVALSRFVDFLRDRLVSDGIKGDLA